MLVGVLGAFTGVQAESSESSSDLSCWMTREVGLPGFVGEVCVDMVMLSTGLYSQLTSLLSLRYDLNEMLSSICPLIRIRSKSEWFMV